MKARSRSSTTKLSLKQQKSSQSSAQDKDLAPGVDDIEKFLEASKIIDKKKEDGQITDNDMISSLMNDNARKSMAAGS